MFMGPYDQAIAWDTNGMKGIKRFLDKAWGLKHDLATDSPEVTSLLHKTIKKVGDDIDSEEGLEKVNLMIEEKMNDVEKRSQDGCLG